MVFLSQIYTKSGDAGQTGLGDGSRVAKTHARVVAFGAVDELNSVLGLVRTAALPEPIDGWLFRIQNDLFDVGADLCVPESSGDEQPEHPPLRVTSQQVSWLEACIDEINEGLEPLTSFVLPGGSPASAWMHVARTVCRRAEIAVWMLKELEPVNDEVVRYLNRLSDLLFVLGQHCNDLGRSSVLWVPGANRDA
ncbi:MAG: cob(I)yrinic acid a,c-diamide adenosyltransferase [Planctomycetota bacterium]|nr:cob(I)yrinic acid a,c-diamide adenosyltransferase [Planctomycetota bacterium]